MSELNLNKNQIGVRGTQYLSEALRNKTVNKLFNSKFFISPMFYADTDQTRT